MEVYKVDEQMEKEKIATLNRVEIDNKAYKIVVIENELGLIVDVYGQNDLITTGTYWNEDQEVEQE